MSGISLVINTLNEEKNIASCITSAKDLADEIIVCDMFSDDGTVEIAASLGARIIFHERTEFVEPARFFAISKATCEWVLILDADERMTEKLAVELRKLVQSDSLDLVLFASLFNYFGRYVKHGGFFFNSWPRLFRKSKYLEVYEQNEERVHQNFVNLRNSTVNQIRLPKDYYIIHEAYPTIEKYIQKTIDKYSIIESNGRYNAGEKVTFIKVWLAPLKEFLMSYIMRAGFRDGKIGLIICFLKSQHTFYVLLNLWFLNKIKDNENISV